MYCVGWLLSFHSTIKGPIGLIMMIMPGLKWDYILGNRVIEQFLNVKFSGRGDQIIHRIII